MSRSEPHRRLKERGYQIKDGDLPRLVAYALGEPQAGRPIGAPGHRWYTELDYRRVVAWLRVHELCGADREVVGLRLRREAVDLMAHSRWGYAWINNREVGWSALPPVGILRTGAATCWPVSE